MGEMREKEERESEKGRERERSSERVRERSPMIPSEGTYRKHPPDCSKNGKVAEGSIDIPSTEKYNDDGAPLVIRANEGRENEGEKEKGSKQDLKAKTSKHDGGFTGDVTLVPREEEWMEKDSVPKDTLKVTPTMSYKEVLKPKTQYELEARDFLNDTWDGSLLCNNEAEMREGIVITNTTLGPNLEFTEAKNKG